MSDTSTPTFLESYGLAETVSLLVFVGQLRLCYVCLRLGSRVVFVVLCCLLWCCF